MDKLQQHRDTVAAQADKLDTEVDHLLSQIEGVEGESQLHPDSVQLALVQAKRVRRESVAFVKVLAKLRDSIGHKAE